MRKSTFGFTGYETTAEKRRTYNRWQKMHQRCSNPKDKFYADYGGRGITVCERWNDILNFVADMGYAPAHLSLDRIDNSKGYSKENCRWATHGEQSRNRRFNVNLMHDGKTQCVMEWSRELGITEGAIFARIKLGWPVEKILTTPLRRDSISPGKLGTRKGGEETENLVGVKVGRLTIIEFAGIAPNRVSKWLCRCDCGNERTYRRSNLLPGAGKVNTLSCGCHRKEIQKQRLTGHNVRRKLNS